MDYSDDPDEYCAENPPENEPPDGADSKTDTSLYTSDAVVTGMISSTHELSRLQSVRNTPSNVGLTTNGFAPTAGGHPDIQAPSRLCVRAGSGILWGGGANG
jgi:hypothetical protein